MLRPYGLLCLAMGRMLPAARAVFLQFHAARVITTILLSSIVPLFAIATLQRNHWADIFFLGSHSITLLSTYSMILVMTPAPTVKPPSRIANFEPCSNPTGTINSTVRFTLSPGITISTPAGRLMFPVTSIVRI